VDPSLALTKHKSCYVHGGDGFAFVLHGDSTVTDTALGQIGDQLGYGGITNSLAVEFDTWTNVPQQGSDDVFHDHISVHSAGHGLNGSGESTSLGYWRHADLADGMVHHVRIKYVPYLEHAYLEAMSFNDNLTPYLKDSGDGRSIGTLAIFIDDGIAANNPILAISVNLSLLLDLPQSSAFVGFTAATGLKWQKHDILDWNWCELDSC
jgi:hypothetical protein